MKINNNTVGALFLGLLAINPTFAQSPRELGIPAAPTNVIASDGDHERYILIRWDAAPNAQKYRLFRSSHSQPSDYQEITKNPQSSTWFCDYDVQKNVDYYYAVIGTNGQGGSSLSNSDKGFLRKADTRRAMEDELLSEVQGITSPRTNTLAVTNLKAQKPFFHPLDSLDFGFEIKNPQELPVSDLQIRIFLSNDNILDWEDTLLKKRFYSSFPNMPELLLRESCPLPANLLPERYYLFVVLSLQGEIFNSKTGLLAIEIKE